MLSRDRVRVGKRSRLLRAWGFLCLISLLGCRGLGKPDSRYDLLEAELRTRERELRDTRAELDHLRLLDRAVGVPLDLPGTVESPSYRPTSRGTVAATTLPLREVVLGNGTGGVDEDGKPGQESLMVVVVPKDDDGTAIKLPGRLVVTAEEMGRDGLKSPLARWTIPPEELRRTWRHGLLASGYFVPLKWDRLPREEKVRIAIRFTTLEGRDYEADRDIAIVPITTGALPPTVPLPTTELPFPSLSERFLPPARMRLEPVERP